ncbi:MULTISPECIES: hypothetical protein [Microbacterium]|uniref:Uncharacterized protein n=1 Tax=Microbacterium wangchenii TaxID=2541726 RepID=A0ABX5SV48_9MICO|nr:MULTISPECIES: hypothetical protein [Microbacterium]MCK6065762.1 hypothetical protein [Microbacterium sp. EYE_512]QBR90078.1 hypothetical protein E4K62_16150 [Microbacterium wangchenii]
MQIIFQKSTGKPLRRATENDARAVAATLRKQYGELEFTDVRDTALGEMEYEKRYRLEDVIDLDRTYCSECGRGSVERPASEMIAIRHRSAQTTAGAWNFYCPEHSSPNQWGSSGARSRAPHREALCSSCFTLAPVGTECAVCGELVNE